LGGEIASGPPPVSLGRVTERTDEPGVIDFFRYLGWLLGGTLSVPHDYSAGSLFYGVKKQIETLDHYPSQSYRVKGGIGAIAGPLIEAIEERGGEIRTGSAVAIWDILSDDWERDIRELFPGIVEKAHWRLRSFGPATLIETPGNVGSSPDGHPGRGRRRPLPHWRTNQRGEDHGGLRLGAGSPRALQSDHDSLTSCRSDHPEEQK
jgi:hypothetical protein